MPTPITPFESFEGESPPGPPRQHWGDVDRPLHRSPKWILPPMSLDTLKRANERLAVEAGIEVPREIPRQCTRFLRAFSAVKLRPETVPQKPAL